MTLHHSSRSSYKVLVSKILLVMIVVADFKGWGHEEMAKGFSLNLNPHLLSSRQLTLETKYFYTKFRWLHTLALLGSINHELETECNFSCF